jgi:gliding motility-associated-like protein
VDEPGSYSLLVRNSTNCISKSSDPTVVTVNICSTNPPVIEDKVIRTSVKSRITESLIEYFSDKDNDVDLSSIEIIKSAASGALTLIDANHNLVLDYSGLLFAGDETITVKICDLAKNCTTGELVIRVSGDVIVYNAISPNGDGLNEGLYLEYIDLLEETKNNRVRIFNRWGDTVYDAENYNNASIAFKGLGTNGEVLPPDTYFYRMDFSSGIPYKTGYFSLLR